MSRYDSKETLWSSISGLMQHRYGKENLNRLARDVKVSPATATRLKMQETSVGFETLDKLALFFDCPQWQLLVPGYDPTQLPALLNASQQGRDLAKMFDAINDPYRRQQAYELIVQIVNLAR